MTVRAGVRWAPALTVQKDPLMNPSHRYVHLSDGGASLVIAHGDASARVVHWGRAVSDADAAAIAASDRPGVMFSSLDAPRLVPLLAGLSDGWSGLQGLEWHRGERGGVALELIDVVTGAGGSAQIRWRDAGCHADVEMRLVLRADGVLSTSVSVTSSGGDEPLDLLACRMSMPLPARAAEILDFTGRWTTERVPQRVGLVHGAHSREVRRGRPGHDAPYVTCVGTPGFGWRSGEVWAAHVAFSGDHQVHVEVLPEGAGVHGARIVAGEILAPGEVRLGPGHTYSSPEVLWVASDSGLDEVRAAFHARARSLPGYPTRPRPVTINTWEAVYFDHDEQAIRELLARAARIGVERFVLDDGWFLGRRDDTTGLGDWWVDTQVWPHGLRPLADTVRAAGLEMGLWVEPEMVNPSSRLAAEHPEWILGGVRARTARHQLPLDLSLPAVRDYLLERLDALVSELDLAYLKWDHNRDLHEVASAVSGRPSRGAGVRGAYALIDALRERHPGLEIESCASGGGRMDMAMAARTQRFWASDTNDPLERQRIQQWSSLLLPLELLGSHVGPERAHTTRRTADLSARLATALFGHAGIEWDLRECSPAELDLLAAWTAMYKRERAWMHRGRAVATDPAVDGTMVHGVVAADGSQALYAVVATSTAAVAGTPRLTFPGLDADATYHFTLDETLGRPERRLVADPEWVKTGASMSGATLERVGLPIPALQPGHVALWRAVRNL